MTLNRLLLFVIFLSFFHFVNAQLIHLPIGRYNGKSGQAMAIYKDKAFLFNDEGHCRFFDLYADSIYSEFDLSSANKQNHANAACFGTESSSFSFVPFLYVTECKNECRCFVEEVLEDTTHLVQTIKATRNGKPLKSLIWVIDNEKKVLYSVSRSGNLKKDGYAINTITGFKLPIVGLQKDIVLTEKDVIVRFSVKFPNILQDAVVKNGNMYIATGLQQSKTGRIDGKRAIQVIDLEKKEIIQTIDLTYLTTNEPEGIDFHGEKLLLFCGQEGGIYEIKNYK